MNSIKRHIVLITPGQPATNPRLLKEAKSLNDAGYKVTVIYAFWTGWAEKFDREIIQDNKEITWIQVGGHPVKSRVRFLISRLQFKFFSLSSHMIKSHRKYAVIRASYPLIVAAKNIRADLYIAHNLAALPAAAIVAKVNHSKYAFDAEDYHRGQYVLNSVESNFCKWIEEKYIPHVSYLTCASPLISEKYKQHFPQIDPVTVNNVFSIRNFQDAFNHYKQGEELKIFWFSQSVGYGRGIEMVIESMGRLKDSNISFSVLGSCTDAERARLLNLALENGVRAKIIFYEPVEESEIFAIASKHHIGLALEAEPTVNRDICLTNKIFTYLLSGLAIVATSTSAQKKFLDENPGIGKIFENADVDALTEILNSYLTNESLLNETKMKSLEIAKSKFNWEFEQSVFLKTVESVLE